MAKECILPSAGAHVISLLPMPADSLTAYRTAAWHRYQLIGAMRWALIVRAYCGPECGEISFAAIERHQLIRLPRVMYSNV